MRLLRYARLLRIQLRTSLLLALQYRHDFLVDGAISVFYAFTAVVPLFVIYGQRPTVAGWSFGEALLVVGWFTLLQGVIEGAINPSLGAVVEHIRKGTLDFVLLKPADAQFLVSTTKFLPWHLVTVVSACAIFGYGFHLIGRLPGPAALLGAGLVFVAAVVILYSLWIMIVSAAFYVVKVDNLTFLFSSIFDAARWPIDVFRGFVRILFTFVIPLSLMTTFPARALLGRLGPTPLLACLAVAVLFAATARLVWLRAIRSYTSASS